MAVDGAAGHGEHAGDLGDGVLPGVVEALGEGDLVGAEFGGSSTAATAGARGGESVAGVGHDEFPLQLGEDREHPEHGAALGGGGVDALFDDLQPHPAVTQLRTSAWLRQSDDQDLIALAQHFEMLDNTVEYVADQSAAGEPAPLFIFATHLSKHRAFLGEVATGLAQFGVTLFVAHDSIPVDAPWEKEIVDALNRCHAGAAFIHPGLYDSYYCMQEAGWMLGRGIPIARLMFGDTPKGLLGEKQGMQLDGRPAMEVAAAIMDWSLTHSVLVSQVAASLTTALGDSESYATTDSIWDRLKEVQTLSDEQLRRVVHAAEANGQVFGANVGGWSGRSYRKVIGERVAEWGVQDALADRGMRLRKDTEREYISDRRPGRS